MDRLTEIEQDIKTKHSWEDARYFLTAKGEYEPGSHLDYVIAEVKRLRTLVSLNRRAATHNSALADALLKLSLERAASWASTR